MRLAYILMLAALMLGNSAAAAQQHVTGIAKAIDGDTIDVSGVRIRLVGIDAPEARQTCQRDSQNWDCGADAAKVLAGLVDGQTIKCQANDTDTYGNLISTCDRDGLDLGLTMIEAGLAVTTPSSPERYAIAEDLRKTHKIGIWSGAFQMPAEWRAANPLKLPAPNKVAQKQQRPAAERVYRNQFGCAIKGNRSRTGEWIYHLPGRPYYDQTRPEQLFCTESQAQRAGYRRSKA